jgi:hypothetical protein
LALLGALRSSGAVGLGGVRLGTGGGGGGGALMRTEVHGYARVSFMI